MYVVVMEHEDKVRGYARLVDKENVEQLWAAAKTTVGKEGTDCSQFNQYVGVS